MTHPLEITEQVLFFRIFWGVLARAFTFFSPARLRLVANAVIGLPSHSGPRSPPRRHFTGPPQPQMTGSKRMTPSTGRPHNVLLLLTIPLLIDAFVPRFRFAPRPCGNLCSFRSNPTPEVLITSTGLKFHPLPPSPWRASEKIFPEVPRICPGFSDRLLSQ